MGEIERQGRDDQIGVITLMRLMWKWKMVILGSILLGSLVAFTISVLIPHVYEVDMVIENVQIGTDTSGKRAYVGDLSGLKDLIDAGAFTQDILDSLKEQYKDVLPRRISFETSLKNNNQFAEIAYETVDVEMGEKILSQLYKRLQETNLVRIEHWKKETDNKLEEKRAKIDETKEGIILAEKNERLKKQESLAKAKDDSLKKEDMIKQLEKERDNRILEKMSDMNAEKSKNENLIKNLEKGNSEIKSMITLIESETNILTKTRSDLFSQKDETRNIGVVGELSSVILDGYDQLIKLRQKFFDNDNLLFQVRLRVQELDAGIEKFKNWNEIALFYNGKIKQESFNIVVLESLEKELDDESSVTDSTDKARDGIALLEEEIVSLEANKKNVNNIDVIQRPTAGVTPLRPDTKRNVVIGAVVGLFLSLFLSVFLEYVYKKDEGI